LWNEEVSSRAVAVCGDLGLEWFGLDRGRYDELAARVGVIYNCGAQVHFTYPYSILKAANVTGTHEVIRFACSRRRKAVHHVSTLAVFPLLDSDSREISEHSETGPPAALNTGYAQSKW